MLERKIISQFVNWKETVSNKALLVKGARQVGKTTSIRAFAAAYYENFVEINFEKTPSARQAFDGNLDARTILINLSAMGFGPFVPGETLIFFDEIQTCHNARTAIKFLVEDGQFDYVESGSLLGINYSDVSSFPVGYEHELSMYPLDFEEFLWASGVSAIVIENLREYYEKRQLIPEILHRSIMEHYRRFLVVGGMPEVVNTFLANTDFSLTISNQKDILSGYRNDISKYAGSEKLLVKSIFDAIPQQLCRQDKRFIMAEIEKNASRRKYGAPTQWLVDAGMAYYSFNVNNFELPLPMNENLRLYKLFMIDTGLLCAMLLDEIQSKVLLGEVDINEGALTENFVATELVKHGKSLNYYDHKSRQELDFIFPDNDKITILEVKSGSSYHNHASLNQALSKFPQQINRALVLSKNNIEHNSEVTYFPLYMTMFI